jgi:hypothetical protein
MKRVPTGEKTDPCGKRDINKQILCQGNFTDIPAL